jgi:hypothetical protein
LPLAVHRTWRRQDRHPVRVEVLAGRKGDIMVVDAVPLLPSPLALVERHIHLAPPDVVLRSAAEGGGGGGATMMAEEILPCGGEPTSSSPPLHLSSSSLAMMESSSHGYGGVAMEAALASVCGTDSSRAGLKSPGRPPLVQGLAPSPSIPTQKLRQCHVSQHRY